MAAWRRARRRPGSGTWLAVRPSSEACTWRVIDVSGGRKKLLSQATHFPAGSTMEPLVEPSPSLLMTGETDSPVVESMIWMA